MTARMLSALRISRTSIAHRRRTTCHPSPCGRLSRPRFVGVPRDVPIDPLILAQGISVDVEALGGFTETGFTCQTVDGLLRLIFGRVDPNEFHVLVIGFDLVYVMKDVNVHDRSPWVVFNETTIVAPSL